jgi:hypothetical protein
MKQPMQVSHQSFSAFQGLYSSSLRFGGIRVYNVKNETEEITREQVSKLFEQVAGQYTDLGFFYTADSTNASSDADLIVVDNLAGHYDFNEAVKDGTIDITETLNLSRMVRDGVVKLENNHPDEITKVFKPSADLKQYNSISISLREQKKLIDRRNEPHAQHFDVVVGEEEGQLYAQVSQNGKKLIRHYLDAPA